MRAAFPGLGFVVLVAVALGAAFCDSSGPPGVGNAGEGAGHGEALAHSVGDDSSKTPASREPVIPSKTKKISRALQALTSKLGPTLGALDAQERELARDTIKSLRFDSENELSRYQESHSGAYDPLTAATAADLLRTAVLWKAVGESLDRGQYWLGKDYPATLPGAAPGSHYQILSVIHGNTQAAAVFFIEDGGAGTEYNGVVEFQSSQRNFWLQEAARAFNGRPDADRKALYDKFASAKANRGYERLAAEMAHAFPFENHVDERTMIMYAPR